MTIKYEPSKLIKKLRIREKATRLINDGLNINRTTLRALTEFGLLPKKALEEVALKVLKQYREKASSEVDSGATKSEANDEARNGNKLLVARIQGFTLHQQTKAIQSAYRGERYKWLPSVAKEPRKEHIKNYGKIFIVGVGDRDGNDPGDLPMCQCGMELLVDDTPKEFNDRLESAV